MGSSQELQELVMVDGSKMMVDASSDVRAHGRHLWSELVQHSKTEQMLKQYLREVELRNIKKTLDSLKWDNKMFGKYNDPHITRIV